MATSSVASAQSTVSSKSYVYKFFKKYNQKAVAVCVLCKNEKVESTMDAYSHLHYAHYEQYVECLTLNYVPYDIGIIQIPFNATEVNLLAVISHKIQSNDISVVLELNTLKSYDNKSPYLQDNRIFGNIVSQAEKFCGEIIFR